MPPRPLRPALINKIIQPSKSLSRLEVGNSLLLLAADIHGSYGDPENVTFIDLKELGNTRGNGNIEGLVLLTLLGADFGLNLNLKGHAPTKIVSRGKYKKPTTESPTESPTEKLIRFNNRISNGGANMSVSVPQTQTQVKSKPQTEVVRIEPRALPAAPEEQHCGVLLLESVRVWRDGRYMKLEVVDGCRRLVTSLTPIEAAEVAGVLLNFIIDAVHAIAREAEEALKRYEGRLARKLKELEEPAVVHSPRDVEGEVRELKHLYSLVLEYERIINIFNEIDFVGLHRALQLIKALLNAGE